jgi:hypothetical protein
LEEKVSRGVSVFAGRAVGGCGLTCSASSLTRQTCEGVLAFVKGSSAVSDTDTSGGGISKVCVVEEVLKVVDGAAESAVGGGAGAADAGRSTGKTLSAVGADEVPDGTGFEADGGAKLQDGASIGTGGAMISALE